MKNLINRLRGGSHIDDEAKLRQKAAASPDDEHFFATEFLEPPRDVVSELAFNSTLTSRLRLLANEACDPAQAYSLFNRAWGEDRHMQALVMEERARLMHYLEFAIVPAGREVIPQDHAGDFALIVLEGLVAIDRIQPWGARVRLTEAREGDVLGELSLFDAGKRFSSCMTLSRSMFAIVTQEALDRLAQQDPKLGMALMSSLARRLAIRMRQVSARLSALLSAG